MLLRTAGNEIVDRLIKDDVHRASDRDACGYFFCHHALYQTCSKEVTYI